MRKSEPVKVPAWGKRDAGKTFLLTEWSAARAEKWALRALLAYNRGGGEMPNIVGAGMEGIFFLGVQTFLRGQMRAEEVIPILDELLECVQIVRDPAVRDKATGGLIATALVGEDDIQEVQTRMWLRSEVLRVHTNFSPADALSNLLTAIMAPASGSPNTAMSPLP